MEPSRRSTWKHGLWAQDVLATNLQTPQATAVRRAALCAVVPSKLWSSSRVCSSGCTSQVPCQLLLEVGSDDGALEALLALKASSTGGDRLRFGRGGLHVWSALGEHVARATLHVWCALGERFARAILSNGLHVALAHTD